MSLAFAVIFVARINKRRSLNIQSLVDETLLFFQVYRRIPSRWSSRGLAPNVRQRQLTVVLVNDPAHVVLALVPSALVHRLLLTPHHILQCAVGRSEEHTSELQSRGHLVCRLLLEKKKTDKRV